MSGVPQSTGVDTAHDARALSLAHRLLAGTGSASLVAYRAQGRAVLDSLVHGLSDTGMLVVAAIPQAEHRSAFAVPAGTATSAMGNEDAGQVDVRGEIVAYGPEISVRVLAATAHFLGRLEWVERDAGARLGHLPERVAGVLEHPDARLGLVRTDRVLLHDGTGVTAFTLESLAEHHRSCSVRDAQQLDDQVVDVVGAVHPDELGDLFEAGARGWLPARILSTAASTAACTSLSGRVYWVDADATGITLMRADGQRQTVMHLPFRGVAGGSGTGRGNRTGDAADLRAAIEDLLLASLAAPVQRLR